MFEWEGLKVPVEPERSWGSWMCCETACPGVSGGVGCRHACSCVDCIYARRHWEERKCFYEQYYGKWPTYEEYFMGLKVPVPPKKEWSYQTQCGCCVAGGRTRSGCPDDCYCDQCIYNVISHYAQFGALYKRSFREESELPKLTAEVFNRFDCPDWAQYAVLDKRGIAYYTQYKPVAAKDDVALDWLVGGSYRKMSEEHFDASDWQNSLIERPAKDLPKLTQTAFHCPDCPKEAATLKVFPANHVVALDKDDKVLTVMELQCKEGEVKKPEWLFSKAYNRLYRIDDYRQDIPEDAEPVYVQYFTPEELIGLAVKNHKTAKNYLIAAADGLTVTLLGIEGKELLSMPTLVQFYSFTANRQPCCIIDFPQ